MNNRSKEIESIFACIVDYSDVGQLQDRLESMSDDVWLSKRCCCSRHGLRGVPSKRSDVLIDQRLEANDAIDDRDCIEFSVVRKIGRYDGATRDRLAMRIAHRHACSEHERCYLSIADLPNAWRIDVTTAHGVVRWTREYARLNSDLAEYDPERLIMWHWTRYYQHLEHAVAEQTAKVWALTDWAQQASKWTLAEANRSASRALYRASREAGFRKMTLRERLRLGLAEDSGQWHRVDNIPTTDGTQSGAGQCSIEAANGLDVKWNEYDLIQTRLERSGA